MDELIVMFMREFGWTLEYTTDLISKLPIKKLNALTEELRYQKGVDAYNEAYHTASIVCTIINTTPRRNPRTYKVEEFIGRPPRRRTAKEIALIDAARAQGIIIPEDDV